jgi:hypothetical protein
MEGPAVTWKACFARGQWLTGAQVRKTPQKQRNVPGSSVVFHIADLGMATNGSQNTAREERHSSVVWPSRATVVFIN